MSSQADKTQWKDNLIWYVVRVEAQREFAAERILLDNGFNAFCPTEVKMRRANSYQKRKTPHAYALMVRYLFVAFEGPPPWYWLFERFKMLQAVVGIGGVPMAIGAADMQRVFLMSDTITPYRKASNPHRSFMVGENVVITEGAFANRDRPLKVEEIKGAKAKLILDLFGSAHEVMVPLEFLDVA